MEKKALRPQSGQRQNPQISGQQRTGSQSNQRTGSSGNPSSGNPQRTSSSGSQNRLSKKGAIHYLIEQNQKANATKQRQSRGGNFGFDAASGLGSQTVPTLGHRDNGGGSAYGNIIGSYTQGAGGNIS